MSMESTFGCSTSEACVVSSLKCSGDGTSTCGEVEERGTYTICTSIFMELIVHCFTNQQPSTKALSVKM